ncbi:hypothetical protein E2C01_030846 [Portunus trituberculatus]|uniref:Uncharacterized protein n=1 Tax=Portunus trituberculatus TaxID=210409 RepID=A0A5B7ESY1_PORTR|nr:hypothetical protein [Portunus trituberculatus]
MAFENCGQEGEKCLGVRFTQTPSFTPTPPSPPLGPLRDGEHKHHTDTSPTRRSGLTTALEGRDSSLLRREHFANQLLIRTKPSSLVHLHAQRLLPPLPCAALRLAWHVQPQRGSGGRKGGARRPRRYRKQDHILNHFYAASIIHSKDSSYGTRVLKGDS